MERTGEARTGLGSPAPFAVVSGGFGCLLVVAIVTLTLPALRAYRTDEPVAAG